MANKLTGEEKNFIASLCVKMIEQWNVWPTSVKDTLNGLYLFIEQLLAEREQKAVEKVLWKLIEKEQPARKYQGDMLVVGKGYIFSELQKLAEMREDNLSGKRK